MSEQKNHIEELLMYGYARAYLFVLTTTVALFNFVGLITVLATAWWERVR